VVEGWLVRLARHPSPAVRVAAGASAAARRGAVATLVGRQLLVDKEPAVRRAGIGVLGAAGRRDAVADLAGVVKRGTAPERLGAIEALAASGLAEAVPVLVSLLTERSMFGGVGRAELRRAAARALTTLPHQAARAALADHRDDKDEEVRAVARAAMVDASSD
jgi:HEAT repeat protein